VANDRTAREPPPVPPEVAALPQLITIWSADVLKQQLISDREPDRLRALAMCLQPKAPINECVAELHRCVERALENPDYPLLWQLCAIALGSLAAESANDTTDALLAKLAVLNDEGAQTHAAHALFRLQRLPEITHQPIARLLRGKSENLRKVANLCLTAQAQSAAPSIVEVVGKTSPAEWTTEALDALAKSCGDDAQRKQTVEDFLIRGLKDQPLVPVGVAVFTALARMNPNGRGLASLVSVASQKNDRAAADAALTAISQLGRDAKSAGRDLAKLLAATDDPAREEALCRLLVTLETPASELPVARIIDRVATAPDRASAAHCLLLAFHAKQFQAAADMVRQRFDKASAALQRVLAATYKALTGQILDAPKPQSGAQPTH
jgi:hypothetical protein